MVAAAARDAVQGDPLDAPITGAKFLKMDPARLHSRVPLQWALKDVDLAISATLGGTLPLLAALSGQWRTAVAAGHGRPDISAARLALGSPCHASPRQQSQKSRRAAGRAGGVVGGRRLPGRGMTSAAPQRGSSPPGPLDDMRGAR